MNTIFAVSMNFFALHPRFQARRLFYILCFCLGALLGCTLVVAEEEPPTVEPDQSAAKNITTQAFIPLTEEDRFSDLLNRGIAAFEAQKFEEATGYLDQGMAISPKSAFLLNLRGAIFTKKKNFDAARENFQAALAVDPQFFPARFNLGELLFLQGNYEEALDYFELLKASYLRNELIQFKLIILFALTDRREDAARTLQRLRFPGETPSWYYSHAAFRALEGDKRDSRRYLRAAREIFPPEQIALYEESMQEAKLLR